LLGKWRCLLSYNSKSNRFFKFNSEVENDNVK
jgi:hypothetical protein